MKKQYILIMILGIAISLDGCGSSGSSSAPANNIAAMEAEPDAQEEYDQYAQEAAVDDSMYDTDISAALDSDQPSGKVM